VNKEFITSRKRKWFGSQLTTWCYKTRLSTLTTPDFQNVWLCFSSSANSSPSSTISIKPMCVWIRHSRYSKSILISMKLPENLSSKRLNIDFFRKKINWPLIQEQLQMFWKTSRIWWRLSWCYRPTKVRWDIWKPATYYSVEWGWSSIF